MITKNFQESKTKIKEIQTTPDCLTSRAGLSFIVRYIENIHINPLLTRYFGSLRLSRKGLPIKELFKQIFCFFIDGTSLHLTRFDELAGDKGYAGVIETDLKDMVSSHQIKRFFKAFSFARNYLFRRLLQDIFIWRLNVIKPAVIILDLDTMVMANNDANKRQGVKPTYKKVKGFQPLLLKWQGYIIDAVFRGGNKHSNHGDTVFKMIKHVVRLIRKKHGEDVPIILKSDSGFYDQENFNVFEEINIGYIIGGKIYNDIQERVENTPEKKWVNISRGKQEWKVLELIDKRGSWDKFRRAIFTRALYEDNQKFLPLFRPERIWYTNLGMAEEIDTLLKNAGMEHYIKLEKIIKMAHERGTDELTHRGIKDFGGEQLPFKQFEPNTAFFCSMLVAYNIMEAFKEDVSAEIVPKMCYPTTFRRMFIDIAGKIVRTGGNIILKVTEAVGEILKIGKLWKHVNSPPALA